MSRNNLHFTINRDYSSLKFSEDFKEHYSNGDVEQFNKCPNSSKWSINELVEKAELEARHLPFKRNRNDMYTFSQSVDIANITNDNGVAEDAPFLSKLRSFLLSDVRPWLERLTGAPLEKTSVDFTASIYRTNNVLLCHDDELDNRRIAFIWYLVPSDWDADKEGGCLDLFSSQPKESATQSTPPPAREPPAPVEPWSVGASVAPRRNRFAFFEPSAYSFHQVAEVLGKRDRLSLHGWFHGPPLPRPLGKVIAPTISRISPIQIDEEMIYRWINSIYLDMNQQAKIRRRFIKSSEIQLTNFLKLSEWSRVCASLADSTASSWSECGPFNRQHFDALINLANSSGDDDCPKPLQEVRRLFQSEAMQVVLSDLTGIRLHPSSLQPKAKVPVVVEATVTKDSSPDRKRARKESSQETNGKIETTESNDTIAKSSIVPCALQSEPQIRRWQPGCYSMLPDASETVWRLETVLHVAGYGQKSKDDEVNSVYAQTSSKCWQADWGGQIVFTADGEIAELLTVHPVDNALTLIYTGPQTANFVRYISHAAQPWPLKSTTSIAESTPPTTAAVYDLAVVFEDPQIDDEESEEETKSEVCSNDGGGEEGDNSDEDDEEEEESYEVEVDEKSCA